MITLYKRDLCDCFGDTEERVTKYVGEIRDHSIEGDIFDRPSIVTQCLFSREVEVAHLRLEL